MALQHSDDRSDPPDDVRICGYRAVRRLHSGERTDVYLGEDDDGRTVALRIFNGSNGPEDAVRELSRSEKVRSDHVPRIIDVGSQNDHQTVLICDRLSTPLSERLTTQTDVAAGSIVSLLGGIGRAVAAFHDAGLVHGNISTSHIRFSDDGLPVLVGDDGGDEARPIAVGEDLRDLATVAEQLLLRTDSRTRERGMGEIVHWLRERADRHLAMPSRFIDEWECRVFALADPLPFAVGDPRAPVLSGAPTRREASRVRRRRRHESGLVTLRTSLTALTDRARRAVVENVARHPRMMRLSAVAIVVFAAALFFGLVEIPASLQGAPAPATTGAVGHNENGPRESEDPGARSAKCPMGSEVGLLQTGLHARQITRGIRSVDHALIVRQREVHHRSHRDRFAHVALDHNRTADDGTHTQDRGLRQIHQRCFQERARTTGVRQCERPAGELVRAKSITTSPLRDVVNRCSQVSKREVARSRDHRAQQAPFRLDGDAEILT